MPNPIKYSTGTESDALRKGNFHIGTGSVGKGPSDVTGYYQAVSPVSGGYVIYLNKEGAPGGLSYHSAANDSELITFTNNLAGQSYTTVQECFNYYYGQTDKVLVNQDYPVDYPYIVMDGLVLNLDAGITQSYPGSGTVWTDINGLGPKNNGTLINGPTFSSANGGSIVFDGVDDYVDFGVNTQINSIDTYTFSFVISSPSINSNYRLMFTRASSYTSSISDIEIYGGNGGIQLVHNRRNGGSMSAAVITALPNSVIGFLDVVYDASISSWLCYYNSTLRNTFTSIAAPLTSSTFKSNIGTFFPGPSFLVANLYSFKLYNRALTASEVLQNFNAQKGRFGL
jgi:hypothetical protein